MKITKEGRLLWWIIPPFVLFCWVAVVVSVLVLREPVSRTSLNMFQNCITGWEYPEQPFKLYCFKTYACRSFGNSLGLGSQVPISV